MLAKKLKEKVKVEVEEIKIPAPTIILDSVESDGRARCKFNQNMIAPGETL